MENINCKPGEDFFNEKKYINIKNIRKNIEENGIKHVSYLSGIYQAFYKEFSELSDETKKLINTWRRIISSERYDPNIKYKNNIKLVKTI